MTRILAIEETDIRREIDNCDVCPLLYSGDDEYCEKDSCNLTQEEYDPPWVENENGRGYHQVHFIMSRCPLPEKKEPPTIEERIAIIEKMSHMREDIGEEAWAKFIEAVRRRS